MASVKDATWVITKNLVQKKEERESRSNLFVEPKFNKKEIPRLLWPKYRNPL
jgi:hypothetical protein